MHDAPEFRPGTLIGGDFQIERPLQSGGMGAVYIAEQRSTGKRRALKLMHPKLVTDPKSRQRFIEEARIGARIPSEHVVEVVAAGIDEASGVPYLAMELLEGEDLSALVERAGPLSPSSLRELTLQLGHALGAAHRQRIVHRDLKPENIFVARSQRRGEQLTVKVLDFGIAKTLEASRTAATATSALGSPLFMAPEQASPGAPIRASTDVFALGMITFYCLTGRYYWRSAAIEPFNLQALLAEVLIHPMVPASLRASELGVTAPLPPGFDAWFSGATARDASARFADADACIAALESVLSGASASVTSALPFAPTAVAGAAVSGAAVSGVAVSAAAISGADVWANTPGLGQMGTPPPVAPTAHMAQHPASGGPPFGPPPTATPIRGQSPSNRAAVLVAAAVFTVIVLTGVVAGTVLAVRSSEAVVSPARPPVPVAPAVSVEPSLTPLAPAPVPTPVRVTAPTPTAAPAPSGGSIDDLLNDALSNGATGALLVNTMPWSTVYLGERELGRTPLRTRVPVGRHTLTLVYARGERREIQVTVEAGRTARILRQLQAESPSPSAGAAPADERQAPTGRATPSRSEVGQAMGAIAPAVGRCANGATGLAPVRITFGSNGQPTTTRVTSGSLPAATSSCIEQAAMGARVPPFDDPTFVVTYPFRLGR